MKKAAYFLLMLLLAACQSQTENEMSAQMPALEESPVIASQLSNQTVTGFAEDKDGYIWISTKRGLNRYNGHDFHQYYCNDDSLSLPDNQLNGVFQDSKDRIWVFTVNGVAYYTDQDNFHRIHMKADASPNVTQMVENSKGRIFLNLVNSFLVYDEAKDSCETEIVRSDPMDAYTMRLYVDRQDNLWSVCGWTIREYDSNTLALKDSVKLDQFMGLSCMQGEDLWMYGNGGFRIYNIRSKQFKPVPTEITGNVQLQKSTVNCMIAMSPTMMEFYTPNGSFIYLAKNRTLVHQSDAGFPVQTGEFLPSVAFKDSRGNLWLGSQKQGFTVRLVQKSTFNSFTGLSALFKNKSVSSIINDGKDNLWITTDHDGVYHYDTHTYQAQHFDLNTYFPGKKKGENDAYAIYRDRDGYLWMLFSNTIAKFQYQNGSLSLLKTYESFLPLTIYQDRNRTLWVGTYSDYLFTLPQGAQEFSVSRVLNRDFSYVSVIKELRNGTALALTWETGIQQLNTNSYRLEKSKQNAEDMQLSVKRNVFLPTSLLEDSKGRIWIGTIANGLLCYTPRDGHLKPVLGLPCSDVCSMEEDKQGNIWVSTMNGLSKYNPDEQTFSNYNADDGIGGNQFVDRASCRLSDGTLIFGGNHGLTVFNPSDGQKNQTYPLLFEDLKVHNVLIHPSEDGAIAQRLARKPEIHLNYRQNGFSISYAALDYSQTENVQYRYKLEGVDKEWIDVQNSHEAYYANVNPGKYTFRVQATSHDHSIIEGENEITVLISPAPWLTWWAKLFYNLLVLGILYALLTGYLRIQAGKQKTLQAEREKEHELHVNQMNMSFFTNVSHEFRTPLTIISGPIEQLCADSSITGDEKHLLFIVQRSVRRMLRLVNQMMDFHKLENDTLKLEVRHQDVIGLLQQISDLFTINAQEKDITFYIYGLEDKFMMWADADKLEKILTNLLGNAFKFTPAQGKITLSFDVISREQAALQYSLTGKDTDSQYIKISVKDTGKGIPDDEKGKIFERYYQMDRQQLGNVHWGTGIGLYYAKNLVVLHHGYIKVEDRSDGQPGSVFSFILPVSEQSYSAAERSGNETTQSVLFPIQQAQENLSLEEEEGMDNRKKILVVDDDTEVVHYLKALLAGDYHITGCFDAASGLKAMQENAPDLVISDVLMPEVSGYEFCRQIKDNLQLCHIPVVLVTAKASTENQVEGLDAGADAYVIKPFDPAYLKALVHSLLQNREKAQHILSKSTQTTELPEEVLSAQDKSFMDELYSIMEKELGNSELDVAYMTEILHISRTKLYYKIKGLTGENPSVFFRCYKLNRAAELIKEGKYNLSEIADMTGFSSLSHFSTSFKKQFGVTPSDYK